MAFVSALGSAHLSPWLQAAQHHALSVTVTGPLVGKMSPKRQVQQLGLSFQLA